MTGPVLVIGIVVVVLAGLAWYELVLAEGAHLGERVVVWLYDLTAQRYETIKDFRGRDEDETLGWPLALALLEVGRHRGQVLDVASGTGRLPRALLRQKTFEGRIVATDMARRMISIGRTMSDHPRLHWVQSSALRLPFDDDSFDAVTCLESLEFMPSPRAALAECVRVLRPGGTLLVTNRVGFDARLMLGKTWRRPQFKQHLATLPLMGVRVEPWMDLYDLAWARKASA